MQKNITPTLNTRICVLRENKSLSSKYRYTPQIANSTTIADSTKSQIFLTFFSTKVYVLYQPRKLQICYEILKSRVRFFWSTSSAISRVYLYILSFRSNAALRWLIRNVDFNFPWDNNELQHQSICSQRWIKLAMYTNYHFKRFPKIFCK